MIALLVMTDGRLDCIDRAIPSALEHLQGQITRRIIHDDSGEPDYRAWLRARFGGLGFEVIYHPAGRQGFGGAYRNAWRFLTQCQEPFVFSTEDDFTFNRLVPLDGMVRVLEDNPHLAQLALRRQPWNDQERAAGGIVEQHPGDFVECLSNQLESHFAPRGQLGLVPYIPTWLEHRRFWTTNPSLFRRSLCLQEWPDAEHSEGVFTHQLLEDPDLRFAFWGARDSGEWVHHIGNERVGTGY